MSMFIDNKLLENQLDKKTNSLLINGLIIVFISLSR